MAPGPLDFGRDALTVLGLSAGLYLQPGLPVDGYLVHPADLVEHAG